MAFTIVRVASPMALLLQVHDLLHLSEIVFADQRRLNNPHAYDFLGSTADLGPIGLASIGPGSARRARRVAALIIDTPPAVNRVLHYHSQAERRDTDFPAHREVVRVSGEEQSE